MPEQVPIQKKWKCERCGGRLPEQSLWFYEPHQRWYCYNCYDSVIPPPPPGPEERWRKRKSNRH